MYSYKYVYVYKTYNTNIQVGVLYGTGHENTFTKFFQMMVGGFEGFCRGVYFSIREFSSFSTVGRLLVARLVVNIFVFGSVLLSLLLFFWCLCLPFRINIYIIN